VMFLMNKSLTFLESKYNLQDTRKNQVASSAEDRGGHVSPKRQLILNALGCRSVDTISSCILLNTYIAENLFKMGVAYLLSLLSSPGLQTLLYSDIA
jgi:hypothetical protein